MTTKKPPTTEKEAVAASKPANPIPKEERASLIAQFSILPQSNCASVIQACGFVPNGETSEFMPLVLALKNSIGEVQNGDLKSCEAMLTAQATALQSVFANLTKRALAQDHMPNFEAFFRMAMKAQNQCRMTLETLANVKNPPVVFAKQANIAHGHQQVNNGTPTAAHAEKTINQSNELLEVQHGQQLDTGTAGTAAGTNTGMEAVGAIHRATNAGGKSRSC